MNFKETKRDETINNLSKMQAITTAAIITCPELPKEGLHQYMHRPSNTLEPDEVRLAPGLLDKEKDRRSKITIRLLFEAMQRVLPDATATVFADKAYIPQMPMFDRLTACKTEYSQFGAIFKDEGTIEGTYGVHDSMFLDQLGLHASEPSDNTSDDFTSRLWLCHGDQLTAQRIRSVKAEQIGASKTYDRRDWLLGLPAWFHVMMNEHNTIIKTHGKSPEGQNSDHTIRSDLRAWYMTHQESQLTKYHVCEPIITRSFSARVVALFLDAMQHRGKFKNKKDEDMADYQGIEHIISELTPDVFIQLLEDVRLTAFDPNIWIEPKKLPWEIDDPAGAKDPQFLTMCRLLQEIELFLMVRHAVKYGDWGFLRYLVDPLIIEFIGAGQTNYASEMLYYRWLLTDKVCDKVLQEAILKSALVNWKKKEHSFKATDLGLEHLNAALKLDMKANRNSTHDTAATLDRSLTNNFFRQIREVMELEFGRFMPDNHTSQQSILQTFNRGLQLYQEGLVRPQTMPSSDNTIQYLSPNIRQIGVDGLTKKIADFNKNRGYIADPTEDFEDEPEPDTESGIDPQSQAANNEMLEYDGESEGERDDVQDISLDVGGQNPVPGEVDGIKS